MTPNILATDVFQISQEKKSRTTQGNTVIPPNDFSKPYFLGIFVNWRQLAAILLAFAIPYVLGLIMVLPNDMPLPSTRKVQGKLHNGVPIHSPQKLKTSSTEKFFDISEVSNV